MADQNASEKELETRLSEYQEKFSQVEAALKQIPDNEALLKVRADLIEIINLTEDLLRLKRKTVPAVASASLPSVSTKDLLSTHNGTNNNEFEVGKTCMALWTEDGKWYEATILSHDEEDKYTVSFKGYDLTEIVTRDQLALSAPNIQYEQETTQDNNDGSDSENLPKEFVIPKSLRILPTDSEEVRKSKRKRVKAMKSQWKKKQQEGERKEKKNAWQEFSEKTSKRPRTGFLSTTKRESIFKSPDTVFGKVGVTGSGQGVTPSPVFKTTDVKRDSKLMKQETNKK